MNGIKNTNGTLDKNSANGVQTKTESLITQLSTKGDYYEKNVRIPTQAHYTIMIQPRQSKTTHMSSTKQLKDFQIIRRRTC